MVFIMAPSTHTIGLCPQELERSQILDDDRLKQQQALAALQMKKLQSIASKTDNERQL